MKQKLYKEAEYKSIDARMLLRLMKKQRMQRAEQRVGGAVSAHALSLPTLGVLKRRLKIQWDPWVVGSNQHRARGPG